MFRHFGMPLFNAKIGGIFQFKKSWVRCSRCSVGSVVSLLAKRFQESDLDLLSLTRVIHSENSKKEA